MAASELPQELIWWGSMRIPGGEVLAIPSFALKISLSNALHNLANYFKIFAQCKSENGTLYNLSCIKRLVKQPGSSVSYF